MSVKLDFDFLILLLINALVIQGWFRASSFEWKPDVVMIDRSIYRVKNVAKNEYRMILWWLRLGCLRLFGTYYAKPFITCPTCMASVHSTYIFYLGYGIPQHPVEWVLYAVYILSLSGLSTFITYIADK